MHISLIASVLQSIGFRAVIRSQDVIISLNRKISSPDGSVIKRDELEQVTK